jgi:steroid 5-alpha reductase family enzyme
MATERLVDALWGGRPPVTAVKAMQVYGARRRGGLVTALSSRWPAFAPIGRD